MIIEVGRWRSNAYSTTTMLNGQKIVVVMPAYNAARTLQRTYDEVMAHGIVDFVIVVDDASHDDTVAIARTLDRVQVEVHPANRGYGANQKTCYRLALAAGADIIILIHPDSRPRRAAGRNAVVEIRRESVPYVRGESSRRQAGWLALLLKGPPIRNPCNYAKPAARRSIISQRSGHGSKRPCANALGARHNRSGRPNNQDHEYNMADRQSRP